MLPQAATDFYALQQRVNATAANEVARAWRRMGDDFDASWSRVAPVALATLIEAQSQMTEAAALYVPAVLDETGLQDRPSGDFQPDSLVGIASDGRSLDSLAYGAVITAKQAMAGGASTEQALGQGGNWLDLMTKLQVADAARQAVSVMTTSRKNLAGTVRVLNPPSCQRCAILAGRFYRWSQGFDRHPRCDCVNLPSESQRWAEAEGFITDPMDAFHAGHIRDLTEAQTKAITDGADIGQVVNAHRGMSTTSTETAKSIRMRLRAENTVARAPVPAGQPDLLAFVKPRSANVEPLVIPTPEGIYQQAKSRDEAISLLRDWGYIDNPRTIRASVAALETPAEVARSLVDAAVAAEPELTAVTSGLAERFGGRMEGLDFRLKTVDSLTRKLEAEVLESGGTLTAAEAGAKMFDVNRYTTIHSEATYARAVQETLDSLRADGYVLNVKNYWNVETNPYQGVNVQIINPAGQKFELQFHTDYSLEVKEGELHHIYELQRVETDAAKRAEYADQMFDVAAKIPVPRGIRAVN